MIGFEVALAVVFWVSVAVVSYTYLVYPLLIAGLARLLGRRRHAPNLNPEELPTVSLILAAYNEEAVIEDRLLNALAMDYPREKLEILVGSDGSTDATAELVGRFDEQGVRLLDFERNRGKASVLNDAVAEARGEILLMSDANTHIDPQAARKLLRWFADPKVGAVVGRLILNDPETGRNVDGAYWKYETFLKRNESRLGALLGANGAIYAIRRHLYEPIPPDTIVDDFVIPLLAKQRTQCAILYDCEAFAMEETPPNVACEFRRRARIGAGGFQSIGMLWELLHPRHGWTTFTFFSHKVLRWLCPFFLIGALASSLLLWPDAFYRFAFLAQVVFYLIAGLVAFAPPRARWLRPLRLTTMFTSMNLALLFGFWRWLSGRQKGTWKRTLRVGEPQEALR